MAVEKVKVFIENVPIKLFSKEEIDCYFDSIETRGLCNVIAEYHQDKLRNSKEVRP